jgi:NAD(P)-dependent dehydrogenase (short-subunit alcohol dehydrogenase family)
MQTVLITGANRSIGLETVKQLSQKGLFIYLGSRDLDKGQAIVEELSQNGFQNIKAIAIDVTKPDTIQAAKNTIESEQGKLYQIVLRSFHSFSSVLDSIQDIIITGKRSNLLF